MQTPDTCESQAHDNLIRPSVRTGAPLYCGMIATGNHNDINLLRSAPPQRGRLFGFVLSKGQFQNKHGASPSIVLYPQPSLVEPGNLGCDAQPQSEMGAPGPGRFTPVEPLEDFLLFLVRHSRPGVRHQKPDRVLPAPSYSLKAWFPG